MNMLMKEKEIKLEILLSLARSQQALTRMIEQIADVTEVSTPHSTESLQRIDVLIRYQQALANKIAGMRIRHVYQGRPGLPWMNDKQTQGRLASCFVLKTNEGEIDKDSSVLPAAREPSDAWLRIDQEEGHCSEGVLKEG